MIPLVASARVKAKIDSGGVRSFGGYGCLAGGLGGIGGPVVSRCAAVPVLLVLTAIFILIQFVVPYISAEEACYFDCYLV